MPCAVVYSGYTVVHYSERKMMSNWIDSYIIYEKVELFLAHEDYVF